MTDELFNHIVKRIISSAEDTLDATRAYGDDDEFLRGKRFAYYEVLDTIRNDLFIEGYDLKQCGLDFDIDKKYIF